MTQQRSSRRIAVLLEYDGTAYRGSQYQENGPSIQAELEASIQQLTGANVRAAFAGRTDAGVHALGQVAAFDIESNLRPDEFVRGLNHFLPDDIAVRSARDAEPSFDPRRDARNRVYRYAIETGPVRSPLRRNRAWHVGRPLDVPAMAGAAQALEGTHDFAAFAGAYEGSTRRTLRRCEVRDNGCGRIALTMEAEAFLPHQVRRTAGPLVEVGLGRMILDDVVALRDGAAPSSAQPAAPACGLYLVRVEYGEFAFDAPAEVGNGQDG
jgi:tRNA pseudouridine38-40 synthase